APQPLHLVAECLAHARRGEQLDAGALGQQQVVELALHVAVERDELLELERVDGLEDLAREARPRERPVALALAREVLAARRRAQLARGLEHALDALRLARVEQQLRLNVAPA